MDKLHQRLSKENSWYSAWHKIKFVSALHFFVLLGVASFAASSLLDTIAAQDLSQQVAAANASSSDTIGSLTKQMLMLSKQYAAADSDQQGVIAEQLVQVALERKNLLLTQARNNPQDFLLNALPPGIVKQLPDSIRPLLEAELDTSGTLTVLHLDAPPGIEDRDETRYELDSGKYHLRFEGKPSPDLVTDAKVQVHGIALDKEIVLATDTAGAPKGVTVTAAPPSGGSGTTGGQSTLVIMINFTDSTTRPWTTNQITQTVFTASNSSNFFFQDSSFGQVSLSGLVVGWYTLPMTSANCDSNYYAVADAATNAAIAAGVNVGSYSHVMYLYNSHGTCSWGGMGTIGGTHSQAWIFGYNNPSVFTHELGHNLNAHHASTLECGSQQVATYSNCIVNEYGDRSDVMGDSYTYYPQFNGPHKIGEGWLSGTNMRTVTANAGIYTITPTEINDTSTKVLKIAKPNTGDAYYISFRKPIGFDSSLPASYTNGAMIHVWNGIISSQTRLLDTTPGDGGDFSNAALTDGKSFSDPANGITITQLSHSANDVTLSVQLATAICVRTYPTLTITPLSQSGPAGSSVSYTAYIKNNDSNLCPPSTFSLIGLMPTPDLVASSSPVSFTLASGDTGTGYVDVHSAPSTLDALYTFSIQAHDAALAIHDGYKSLSYVVFTPGSDVTPPTIAITSPADGTRLKGRNGSAYVFAQATDASGINNIEMFVDGSKVYNCGAVTDCGYTLTVQSLSSGTHTVKAVATDKAGNTNSATIKVIK